jgi:phage/plasmid-associated DNA primase
MVASFETNDFLKTVTKSRPCLMCGGEDKCAMSDSGNVVLCGRSTAKTGDIVNGYRCKSTSNKNSHCSHTFVKINKSTQTTVKQSPKPTKPAMSREDRDLWNRKIISTLNLSESDRSHLKDIRGLTDQQIDNWGFRSVGANQSLVGNWPDNLPGYRHDKNQLAVSGAGILTPIRQLDQIVAFKVRLTEKKENQRYTCVSDKKYTQYHVDGEQPLAVLISDNNDFSEGTWVNEGNEIKPVIVHLKYNLPVLGGGRYWHSSENHAAKFLPLVREKSLIINLAVDAGDVLHSGGIPLKWVREYKYFEGQGFSPRFAWWGQITKESNDIDELPDLSSVGFINLDQFKELIKEHNPEAYQKIVDDDKPLLTLAIDNTKPSEDPTVTFNQIALKALFDDSYRCVNEKFYQWQGKYHKELDSALILKRIRDFCNSYLIYVENKEGKIEVKYPFANTKSVNEVFKWSQISLAVSYEEFSKTVGINCLNGVLTFDWEGSNKPTPKLELHDPTKHFFTAEPTIEYNPNADTTHCDKLLQSLDPASKEIILRTLAASFDFKKIRELKGRLVRILFLIGSGSNGKDAIGSVINEIFPKAVSSFGLDRFIAYDQGNLNALAGLEKSRINWASESSRTTRIDNSKSLKCLVTGEKLEARYLYQNSQEYEPNTIGLFNLNEMPNLFGTGEAASSRFAPIMFRKTFVRPEKYDPSNPNQLLADSRFKYDIGFIRSEVAPAFLNYMIKGLQDLIADGIDYSCTEEALDQVRSENNHLFDAISEMGWRYDPNASLIRISTLYDQLEAWYIEQGILTKGDFGRNSWQDPVRPSDQYITGSNRLFDRLKAIFPDIERQMKTPLGHSKRVPHIKGISVIFDKPWQSIIPTPTHAYTEPTHEPTHAPTHDGNTSNQDTVRISPTTPTPSTHDFSKSSQKNFKEELDPNFCADFSQTIFQNSVFDDGTEENKKESLGQSWVGGVGSTPETLTTQGLQPLQPGVGSWVGTGVGSWVGSTDVSPSIGDRTLDLSELTSQIKVVDPREQKQQEFTQEQLAENQIIEDIKSQILGFTSSKDHQDLKNTLDFQDYKALRAIRAWLIKGDMKADGTRESVLPKEFVDIWLN